MKTSSVDNRLFTAISKLVLEKGYTNTTVEGVAAAAGVAKTTIYRRWPSKAEMIFALFISSFEEAPFTLTRAESDNLQDDLHFVIEMTLQRFSLPISRAVITGVLADAVCDTSLRERLVSQFMDPIRIGLETLVERAIVRGEKLRPDAAAIIHATVIGTLLAWLNIFDHERPTDLVNMLAKQCLVAVIIPDYPEVL
jgi:AcrR family transcriptional regulator